MSNTSGLHRNPHQKVIAGVCSGLADSLKIDVVLVRLIFVLLAIVVGGGIFIYIVLWIVLPEEPVFYPPFETTQEKETEQATNEGVKSDFASGLKEVPVDKSKSKRQLIFGIGLIAMGAILLLPSFFLNIHFADLWPLALILLGVILLRPSLK